MRAHGLGMGVSTKRSKAQWVGYWTAVDRWPLAIARLIAIVGTVWKGAKQVLLGIHVHPQMFGGWGIGKWGPNGHNDVSSGSVPKKGSKAEPHVLYLDTKRTLPFPHACACKQRPMNGVCTPSINRVFSHSSGLALNTDSLHIKGLHVKDMHLILCEDKGSQYWD